ncbi:MAG TPA: hypothetical protein VK183_02950 [Flavobacterium sp.]|nr:hypothetical protein [Flavobacterium sp.]
MDKVKIEEHPEALYFSTYFGKGSEIVLTRLDESKAVCAKIITYKTSIKLKWDSCSEHGTEVEIVFPNYAKTEIQKFVEWFFTSDTNVWDESKTKYQPKEDGDAGCYLEIIEEDNDVMLRYYCGC